MLQREEKISGELLSREERLHALVRRKRHHSSNVSVTAKCFSHSLTNAAAKPAREVKCRN